MTSLFICFLNMYYKMMYRAMVVLILQIMASSFVFLVGLKQIRLYYRAENIKRRKRKERKKGRKERKRRNQEGGRRNLIDSEIIY